MRITELITTEDIDSWKPYDNIIIQAGTGSGKSYFIQTKLAQYCKLHNKRILMLVHRVSLLEQFTFDTSNKGAIGIDLVTYQALENMKEIKDYDYIVCDEFHYFADDSPMNPKTICSFDKVVNANAIKIFMSATPKIIKDYMKKERRMNIKEYQLESDYSFINSLTFIYGVNDIKDIVYEKLEKKEKVMIFTTSGQMQVESLYKTFKNNSFVYVSEHNQLYDKYVQEELIEEMIMTRQLPRDILISTSVMDAGVSIEDKKAKTVILDVKDYNTLIQCLGRKRLSPNEKIDVYIRIVGKKDLRAMYYKWENELEKCEVYENEGILTYLSKHYNITSVSLPVFVDIIKGQSKNYLTLNLTYNDLYKEKCKDELKTIEKMLENEEAITEEYCKMTAELLKKNKYTIKKKTTNKYSAKYDPKEYREKIVIENNQIEDILEQEYLLSSDYKLIKDIYKKRKKKTPTLEQVNEYLLELGINKTLTEKRKKINGTVTRVKIVTHL